MNWLFNKSLIMGQCGRCIEELSTFLKCAFGATRTMHQAGQALPIHFRKQLMKPTDLHLAIAFVRISLQHPHVGDSS